MTSRRIMLKSIAQIGGAIGVAARTDAATLDARTVHPIGTRPDMLPQPIRHGGLAFLTAEEAAEVAALFDVLIPEDELGMSASAAGCVEFVDRQLAGPWGAAATTYRLGPIKRGTPAQGPQFKETPAERYRKGLADLGAYCQAHFGKRFSALDEGARVQLLQTMEAGKVPFQSTDAAEFFTLLLQNVREGYLSDPIYGGNKDMVGWKAIGFPGARYDYRAYILKKGVPLNLEPISLLDRTR